VIVFTATNVQTQDVFVGTARDSVEEEWASLLSQADGGAEGRFFDQLREVRSDGFRVETWAYSDNPAEARASLREAREDLGAEQIRISRQKPAGSSTSKIRSASMKALMSEFEEAMQGDSGPVDEDEAFEGIGERSSSKSAESERETAKDSGAAGIVHAETDQTSARVQQPSTVVQRETVNSETSVLRHSADSDEQAQMNALMARIQMRRRGLSGSSKSKPAKTKISAQTPAAVETKAKIASGRTGSSAKEKRIREAIEAERERRESLRQVKGRDEQAEMNAVMARIEMRRIAQKKATSVKSKEAAKARKAAEARAARKQAAQEAEAKKAAQEAAKQDSAKQEAGRASAAVAVAEQSLVESSAGSGAAGDSVSTSSGTAVPPEPIGSTTGELAKAKRVSREVEAASAEVSSPEGALRHQTRSRQQQVQIRELVAEIEGRRLAQKAERDARTEADRKRREARARRQAARQEVAEADAVDAGSPAVEVAPHPKSSGPKVQADARVPTRLASGRTGSAAKERRIREAIEQEKAMREANLNSRRAAEADEMAAILSRLDARGKEAERIKRRR
jgi:colicin import membrane protein